MSSDTEPARSRLRAMFDGVPLVQSGGYALFALVNMITAGIVGLSANRILDAKDRGTFAVGMAIVGITAWIAAGGTTISYRRLAAQRPQEGLKVAYVKLVLFLLSPFALVLSAVAGRLLMPANPPAVVVLLVASAAAANLVATCLRAAVAHHRSPVTALSGSLGGSVAMVVSLPVAISLEAGMRALLVIQLLGSVAEVGIHAVRLHTRVDAPSVLARSQILGIWRGLLQLGRPDFAYMVAYAALFRGDRLVLSAVAPAAVIGVYAAMTSISEIPLLLAQGGGQAVFRSAAADRHDFSTRRLVGATVVVTAVLGLGMVVLAGPMISIAAGSSYAGGRTALRLLALTLVPAALFQLLGTVQSARGASASAALAGLAGFVVTALADVALAPTMGAEGAALAATIGYVVAAGALLTRVRGRSRDRGEAVKA